VTPTEKADKRARQGFTITLNTLYSSLSMLEQGRSETENISGAISMEALCSAHRLLIMQYESILEMMDAEGAGLAK